jgi:cell shape-determining protein MreC
MMDRSQDSRNRFFRTLAAAGVLVLVFFCATPAAPYLRGVFASIVAPRATDSELRGLSRDALIARVVADEEQLSRVKYQAALYTLLSDENTKLLQALHAAPPVGSVVARVIRRPPHALYDTIIIDQGTASGVVGGDMVEYQGIALGKIASAGKESSLVQFFSSPGTNEDVLVGSPKAIVVANGLGGGAFQLFVPRGISVSVGDAVRAEGSVPLLLGTVVSVSSDPSASSQTVSVRSPVSFGDLDFVEVLPTQR